MKKILIITGNMCDDSEILYPYYRVIEEGMSPTVASIERGEISAKYHFTIDAQIAADEIDESEYDGLILPGGMAPETLRQNKYIVDAIKAFCEHKKPVAAICHGPQLLFSANVIKEKNATCYPGIRDDLINAGAKYEDKCVVVCENIVTSRIPDDLPFFMKAFFELFK